MPTKITQIRKRDDRIVKFDQEKITLAIRKALEATGEVKKIQKTADKLSGEVIHCLEKKFHERSIPAVEEVQDIVEEVLMKNKLVKTAKAYILYREQHARLREMEKLVNSDEIMEGYLARADWRVKENANMDYSLQGLNNHVASTISSHYWLNKIYPEPIRRAHSEGDFHLHDLQLIACYCCGWDLKDLISVGFGGVTGKVWSKPPKHLRTALGQIVNFFYTMQGETAGAQAMANFDTYLAPFIRYDRLDHKKVKQALQEFLFNMNVPTRVGFQSLSYDELVVIKEKGKIKFREIGQLVDEQLEKNSHRIIEDNPQSFAVKNYDDYQTLSFNEQGRAVWAPLKAFIRHRVPRHSEFVKIRTSRGQASVSQAHSLFSFKKLDGSFKVQEKSALQIKPSHFNAKIKSDNSFVALKSMVNQGKKASLDLLDIIREFPLLHKNIFVKINPTRTLEKIKTKVIAEYQGFLPFYLDFGLKDRGIWQQSLISQSIRYDIWQQFGDHCQEIVMKLKNSQEWIEQVLRGEKLSCFVNLCAWYISEGHNTLTNAFCISQSARAEIESLMKDLGVWGYTEKASGHSKKKSTKLKPVYKIFAKGLLANLISLSCGTYSQNKVIPWFIYELSPELQARFIKTLLKGDAAEYQEYWDYTTTSKKLSLSLGLLLAQNGYKFSVYEEDLSKKNKNWSDQYIIRIYKNKKAKENYSVADFAARTCSRVERFHYDQEYEYDLSVDLPTENFAGGSGLLMFHNTPFTNITFDLIVPKQVGEEAVIIGGEPQKEQYKDFQEERDLLNEVYAELMLEGDAKGRVFSWPIPTYNITKDFAWDNPKYEPIWEMTAKYGVPYFCLAEDTKIITDRGMRKIKEVKRGDMVLNEEGGEKPISFKKKTNFQESLEISGKDFRVVCSKNHRFPTPGGLKTAEALSLKDKLLIFREELTLENGMIITPQNKEFFDLKKLSDVAKQNSIILKPNKIIKKLAKFHFVKNRFQTTINNIKIPSDLDEELMELIGIILGDGSMGKKGVRIVNADREIISFVMKVMRNKFNIRGQIRPAGISKVCQEISFNSVILMAYLEFIGLPKNNYAKKRIPQICYFRTNQEMGALLRGLFDTDGSIILNRRQDHIINIYFSNKELINDVLLLLTKVGIAGKLDQRGRINITGGRNIRIFSDLVSFRIKRKREKLNYPFKETNKPSIGDRILPVAEASKLSYHYQYRDQEFVRVKGDNKDPHLFVEDYKKGIITVNIETIKSHPGSIVMYDIEVASKNHLFVLANGIITHNSNFINSDMDPGDARSMCPLAGDEKVLVRSSRGRGVEYSSIRNIYEGNSKREDYEIYSDGRFVLGRFNKFNNQKMLKVILDNGHELKISEQHLNYILKDEKSEIEVLPGKELIPGQYLPYSLKSYPGKGGDKNLGFFVGAFAGDGSFDGETTVVFSLEKQYKKETIKRIINIASNYFGANCVIKEYQKTKLVTLKVHSRTAVGLCQDFVAGKERNKHYQARLFTTSLKFRQGVLAGHLATDGGNRNRIYTSSLKMIETLNMLAATLGTTTSIYKDERPNRLGTEPNYVVLIYQLNRQRYERYGKVWFKKNNKLWVRIKKIQSIAHNTAYCFAVKNDEPMFTVGTTGILTHNCRLRLDNRELRKRGGGLFGANPLTGSIGVVTINMPRLGYLSKDQEEFNKRLIGLMNLAYESLELKRKTLERLTENGLYPYSRFYLRNIKERFGAFWQNHFSTIGLNGLNEACMNLLGKSIVTPEGHKLAEETLDLMREKLMDYQKESNNLYNLEATPAEGTSYRFAKIDKKKYADIIVANEEACQKKNMAPYYTNSSQLPVSYTDDIFEALDQQDSLQTRYTGGTVLHGFVGEKMPSGESVKKIVKKIATNYHLPYFTITPTFSICPKHGYLAGEHKYCPECDQEIGYVDREEKNKLGI